MTLDHTMHPVYVSVDSEAEPGFPSETALPEGRFPSIIPMDDEDQPPLPSVGDLSAILSEMQALQAVSDAITMDWARDRALALSAQALKGQPEPHSMEGWVVRVALAHCLGQSVDLPPFTPSDSDRGTTRTFEVLAYGWIRWVTQNDPSLLEELESLPPEDNQDMETIALSFWGQALRGLIQGDLKEAKRFFDRSLEIGSQFGTPSNPGICWTYAASFFPKT